MSATAETIGVAAELDRELTERLRESGHRVTSQRLLVHRAVCEQQRHLTAEQVLGSVSRALPSISLPTIYATLELLEDLGLVRRVSTGTGALLFESRRSPHAHAACRRCGQIVDVPVQQIDPDAFAGARAAGFAPEEAQLIVFGLCESCLDAR
jgi:Fe2+ or Zn2+ uptake regulation protein